MRVATPITRSLSQREDREMGERERGTQCGSTCSAALREHTDALSFVVIQTVALVPFLSLSTHNCVGGVLPLDGAQPFLLYRPRFLYCAAINSTAFAKIFPRLHSRFFSCFLRCLISSCSCHPPILLHNLKHFFSQSRCFLPCVSEIDTSFSCTTRNNRPAREEHRGDSEPHCFMPFHLLLYRLLPTHVHI